MPSRTSTSNLTGLGCLILFTIPFCAGGIIATVMAVRELLSPPIDWGKVGLLVVCSLVFCGAGFGLLIATAVGSKKQRRVEELKRQHPDEPWMWRQDWAAGKAECSTRATMLTAWMFSLFWNLVSSPVPFLLPEEVFGKKNYLALLGLMFPVIGLGLLVWAVRSTLRWRKFGKSVFEMESVPGFIGGSLNGIIRTATKLEPEDGYHLKLTCINKVTSGSGDSRTTRERILWQEQQIVAQESAEAGWTHSAIAVSFRIPPDCRETDSRDPDNAMLWRLEATAKVVGVDYKGVFEVPVFKTEQSAPQQTTESSSPYEGMFEGGFAEASSRPQARWDLDEKLAGTKIRVQTTFAGGEEFIFGAARNPGAATSLTLFTIVWTSSIWLQIHLGAPIIFPILTALFDLLLIWVSLESWFGTYRVRIEHEAVTVTSGIPGLRSRQVVPVHQIERIQTHIGMQAGNTPYYCIEIRRSGGPKVIAARGIKDKELAERLATEMQRCVGARMQQQEPAVSSL